MIGFISDLAIKMAAALEVPVYKGLAQDPGLRLCINVYGTKVLEKRREKAKLLTFLALMDCRNSYESVLEKVKELVNDYGYGSVNPKTISTIKTYRSNIVHRDLDFNKDDLPECAFIWKEEAMRLLQGDINNKKL